MFHNTTPDLQDQDRFFLVLDRSCPKTEYACHHAHSSVNLIHDIETKLFNRHKYKFLIFTSAETLSCSVPWDRQVFLACPRIPRACHGAAHKNSMEVREMSTKRPGHSPSNSVRIIHGIPMGDFRTGKLCPGA